MKSTINALSLLILLCTGFGHLHAQDPIGFPSTDQIRVYFDSEDPNIYQPGRELKFPWAVGTKLYFAWKGGDLFAGTSASEVAQFAGLNSSAVGNHEYTVSAARPQSGEAISSLINLFFDFIKTEDDARGYGLLQFTTLVQTSLDNPNSLITQAHHVQIADETLYSINFQDVSNVCTQVGYQLVVNW